MADRIVSFNGPQPDLEKVNVALKVFDPALIGVSWNGNGRLVVHGGANLSDTQIHDAATANPYVVPPTKADNIRAARTLNELKNALTGDV